MSRTRFLAQKYRLFIVQISLVLHSIPPPWLDIPRKLMWFVCSWHEMGTYDVPAQIDRILMTTGQQKLFYIGHSMGTTMFFVMLSQRPEYNEKIHAMIALAPVAFFTPTKNPYLHFIERIGERFLEVTAVAARELTTNSG